MECKCIQLRSIPKDYTVMCSLNSSHISQGSAQQLVNNTGSAVSKDFLEGLCGTLGPTIPQRPSRKSLMTAGPVLFTSRMHSWYLTQHYQTTDSRQPWYQHRLTISQRPTQLTSLQYQHSDNGTELDRLISLFLVFLLHFLFVPCGRLSWQSVSFLLNVKYKQSYHIIS